MLPNFIIVGAAKCGTTSLYHYLSQHPEIGFPTLKEPKYFSTIFNKLPQKGVGDNSIDKYAIDNWTEYKSLFSKLKKYQLRGEASPDYLLYHKNTALAIKEKLGDIPIIIMLRDPVARAFSAYSNMRRDNREFLPFKEALEAEQDRILNNWDFMWRYIQGSLYAEQIKTFLDEFSNVKFVLFEDFIKNPLEEVNKVIYFLGFNKLEKLDDRKYNPSGIPNNIIAKFILNRNNKFSTAFREILKRYVSRKILEVVSQKSLNKISLAKKDADYFYHLVKKDIIKTEELTNLNLTIWKEKYS